MEKSSETIVMFGGWFIDGSTACLLYFAWMLFWSLLFWVRLVFLFHFWFLGWVGDVVDVVWDWEHQLKLGRAT